MSTYMINSINRIIKIPAIEERKNIEDLDALLIREYLRRVSVVVNELSLESVFRPFLSSELIANSVLFPEQVETINNIEKILNQPFFYVGKLMTEYIKWSAFYDNENENIMKFYDMYEPLIICFERGCSVEYHNGEFLLGNNSLGRINVREAYKQEPFTI